MVKFYDRVKEVTATLGTGTLALSGAASGYRAFSSVLSNGDTCYYTLTEGTQWEVGLGSYSANTLTRATVYASSNAGFKIVLATGAAEVFLDLPASYIATGEQTSNKNQSNGYAGLDGSAHVPSAQLPIGSAVQAWDADLDAIASISGDGVPRRTSGSWAMSVTGYASLLDFIPASEATAIQIGASTLDVSPYVQSAINAGVTIVVPDGTYMFGSAPALKNNTVIKSVGGSNKAIFKALSTMSAPILLDTNTLSGGTGTYAQSNVTIDGITFDGNNRTLASDSFMVRFSSIDGLTLRNCKFQNNLYGLVGIGGCRKVRVEGCEFTAWGKPVVDGVGGNTDGGPALWLAGNVTVGDDTPTSQVTVTNSYFHDSEWCSVYDFSTDSTISHNSIKDVKECGIYCRNTQSGTPSADNEALRHVYVGNRIKGVRRKYISGDGFEVACRGVQIIGNQISDTDDTGIKLYWKTNDVVVSGNVIWDVVKQQATYSTYTNYGHITLIQSNGVNNSDITITNNILGSPDVAPSSLYAIRINNLNGAGNYFSRLNIQGNHVVNGFLTAPFSFGNTPIDPADTTSAICSNVGASDVLTPFNALIKRDNLIGGSDELNAVENGRFERGAVGWTYSTSYWNINNDQTNALSGNYVAVNTDTSGLQRTFDSNYSACEAGDKIYVGAWLKTSASYTATNTMALILWSDKDKNFLSSSLGTNYTTAQTSYVLSSVTGTAPANACYWQVRLLAQKTVGTTYFDNVYSQRLRDASQLLLDNTVTYAKFQQVAASSLIGNATGSLANATGITLGSTLAFSGSALQTAAMTGDVTASANSFATTIASGAVSLSKMANLAANSIIGNNTGSPATPLALTATQVKSLLAISSSDVSGLGTAATVNTGTSGATIPLLNSANTWSGAQTHSAAITTAASASGGANFNIPNGTGPTSPSSGDIWTTTQSVEASINGSTFNLIPLFKALSADATGANSNTAQPWFPSAGGVTVEGSTTYRFKGKMSMNHGATTHTLALGFGGTATVTSILYWSKYTTGTDTGASTLYNATVTSANATVINATQTAANENVEVEGLIRINAGGSLIPQFTFSADPTGTITIRKNSFFLLEKMGANTVTTNGTWA